MTPEQAARFVLSDGKDPDALAAQAHDWHEMLKDPVNQAAFDQAVQAFTDAVDREVFARLWADLDAGRDYGDENDTMN